MTLATDHTNAVDAPTTHPSLVSVNPVHSPKRRRSADRDGRYAEEPRTARYWRDWVGFVVSLELYRTDCLLHRTGKVADGVLALLEDLPIQHIRVGDLYRIVTDPSASIFL